MKFRHTLQYAVFITYCICQTTYAAAATTACRADILQIANQASVPVYSPRSHGAYCDGNVPVLQAGEIDLIGLTLGPILFTKNKSVLHIQRPAEVPAAENLQVVGVDDRPVGSYRLDGLILQQGLDVDTTLAIKPIGVPQDHLALLGLRQVANDITELWPVSSGPVGNTDTETASIKIAIPAIHVSIARCALPVRKCDEWERVATQVPTGAVVKVALVREKKTRVIELNVKTEGAMGVVFTNAFRVAIPGTG
jgi:hypothetical protein